MQSLIKKYNSFLGKNIIDIISFVILFNSAFFPTFIFNKIALLFLMLLLGFLELLNSKLKLRFLLGHWIIYFIFISSFLFAFFFNTYTSHSLQLLLSTALLLLVVINPISKINFDLHLRIIGILISFYSIAIIIYVLTGNIELSQDKSPFIKFVWETSFMSTGFRDVGKFEIPMFQIGSAPILFISLGLWIKKLSKNVSLLNLSSIILITITLMISGQRALILSTFISFFLGFLFCTSFKNKFYVGILLTLFLSSMLMPFLITMLFPSDDFSNDVKIKHFNYFLEQLTIPKFMFGSGLGSEYFSGFDKYAAITENTLLDLMRFVGIPLALLSYYSILFPSFIRYQFYLKRIPFEFFTMVTYLFISLTNPVLFNSYGIYIVCWYWSFILNYKSEN